MFNKLAMASRTTSSATATPTVLETPGVNSSEAPTNQNDSPRVPSPALKKEIKPQPVQAVAVNKKEERQNTETSSIALETPSDPAPALTKSAIKRNRRRWSMIDSDEKQQFAVAVQNREKTRPRKIQLFADKPSPAPEPTPELTPQVTAEALTPSNTPAATPSLPEPASTPRVPVDESQHQRQLDQLSQHWEARLEEERQRQNDAHEQELAAIKQAHAEKISVLRASMSMQERQHQAELDRFMAEAKPQQQKAALAERELLLLQNQHEEVDEQLQALQSGVAKQIMQMAKALGEKSSPELEFETSSEILATLAAVVSKTLKSHATAVNDKKRALDMYNQEVKARKQTFNKLLAARGNIRVLARVRPMNKKELRNKSRDVTEESDAEQNMVAVRNFKKERSKKWAFDRVFMPSPQNTNKAVFEEVRPLVTSVVDGYNACVFAFGQTGAGKTYTMEGTATDPGVSHRTLNELFRLLEHRQDQCTSELKVSMIEIYNENIRDLLNREEGADETKLKVKLNDNRIGRHIPGLIIRSVSCVEGIEEIMCEGSARRSMHATKMNDRSSRSHCVLSVEVFCTDKLTEAKTRGRLQLIDVSVDRCAPYCLLLNFVMRVLKKAQRGKGWCDNDSILLQR